MVVQLGLAMIPRGRSAIASGFTSATTSGTCSSRRHAEELSTTTAPASTKRGARVLEVAPPAEKIAMSIPAPALSAPVRSALSASSTVRSRPAYCTVEPALRAEAKARMARWGTARSASRVSITRPTWPVAPTTAMTGPSAA